MTIVGWIIEGVLFAFIGFLWVRLITDWVQVFARAWEPRGPVLVFLELSYTVTDPPINGLRKVIKPIRIGNFALDISFFLVMIVAYILLAVNRRTLL
ncbi:YggT family protein [Nocardioides ginsengisoli]|uniref:YggT family protein n=1 Tax=Nocardioides ginsengisoli TaxID=363868 RepID=A0ABW3W9K2_9ACTN